MSVPDSVVSLLGPVVENLGVDLVDIEWSGGSLRLFLDEPGGISTDRLAEVSRLVSPILDQHDPVPGRYTLEVSSPGLERRLSKVEHYRSAVGQAITTKLVRSAEHRRVKGRLVSVSEDEFSVEAVEVDGVELGTPVEHKLLFGEVDKTRIVFEWGPTPKPGSSKTKKKGSSHGQ